MKIEKPKFNEKVGFMGFVLAKKIFWINAYHTALMQFNSWNHIIFICIFLLPLQMFFLKTITKILDVSAGPILELY